jgi:metallo-beta-lactamase class B
MHARFLLVAVFVAFVAMGPSGAYAQANYKQLPVTNEAYVKPFPPLRIVGNLYYVGTYDLAVYLITTNAGSILINTGINDSVPGIRSNIEALGFKFADIKLLLATHGHWDHVAGMAEVKRLTGARMLMQEDDASMLEDGGNSDYRHPKGRGAIYEPVKVDQRLKDGDKVRLGDVELTVLHHPGHTKGATSFMYQVRERGRTYNVLIANMASINPGVTVSGMPDSRASPRPTWVLWRSRSSSSPTYGSHPTRRSSTCTRNTSPATRTTRTGSSIRRGTRRRCSSTRSSSGQTCRRTPRTSKERAQALTRRRPTMIAVPDDFPSVFDGSAAHERAKALGEVRLFTERGADDETELARRIGNAKVAVNIRAHAHFTEKVLAACPDLKMISIWGVGTDNIDLAAAARHNVTVCNTPGANAYAVAEHTIALMLAVARKIPQIDHEMRGGAWPREMLTQLCGKTLGVFGSGNIGARGGAARTRHRHGRADLERSQRYAFREGRHPAPRGRNLAARATHARIERLYRRARVRADEAGSHPRHTTRPRGARGSRRLACRARDGGIAGAGLDVFHDEPLKPAMRSWAARTPCFRPTMRVRPGGPRSRGLLARDRERREIFSQENFSNVGRKVP